MSLKPSDYLPSNKKAGIKEVADNTSYYSDNMPFVTIKFLLSYIAEQDKVIESLSQGSEHSHECRACHLKYTPTTDDEDCPRCGCDGTDEWIKEHA